MFINKPTNNEDLKEYNNNTPPSITIGSLIKNIVNREKNEKENLDINKVIDYLNTSNKLPSINKDIDVEFRGFSKEDIEKRKEDNKKGKHNQNGVCAYDLNTGKITIDESKIAEYSKIYDIKENDLLNYMFLHELGHAIHKEWSLDNKDKVIEINNKQDEKFINSIMKVEGFSGMHTKELNNLHSSVLEGYADLYACTMMREIYDNANKHKEAEEIIKKIEDMRQKELDLAEKYNNNALKNNPSIDRTLENKYGYDVVDNIKKQTELYHKNGQKNYKDFDELNESIMEINTDIALNKLDKNLEKYTNEINQSQKNDLNYISGFIRTRLSSKTENAGELFANRLSSGKEIDFKIDSTNGYFNQGKKHALSEGVNKDNFKISSTIMSSRPSLNNNKYDAPANTGTSNMKRPTLNAKKQNELEDGIPGKKPKVPWDKPSTFENSEKSFKPSLNSVKDRSIPENNTSISRPKIPDNSIPVRKNEHISENKKSFTGKNKI